MREISNGTSHGINAANAIGLDTPHPVARNVEAHLGSYPANSRLREPRSDSAGHDVELLGGLLPPVVRSGEVPLNIGEPSRMDRREDVGRVVQHHVQCLHFDLEPHGHTAYFVARVHP